MQSGVYYKQSAECRCGQKWLFLVSIITVVSHHKLFQAALAEYELELANHEAEHANEKIEALLG